MVKKKAAMRPLRRYIIEFKENQTNCCYCKIHLNRVSLIFDGELIDKYKINNLYEHVDEATWLNLYQTRLVVLCRFCSELYTSKNMLFFDLIGFQYYLLFNSSLRLSSAREYILRLRRIDMLLASLNIDLKKINIKNIRAVLLEKLSSSKLKYSVSALNKYEEYLKNNPK